MNVLINEAPALRFIGCHGREAKSDSCGPICRCHVNHVIMKIWLFH